MSNLTYFCRCHGNQEQNMARSQFSGNRGTSNQSFLQEMGKTEKGKVYNILLIGL